MSSFHTFPIYDAADGPENPLQVRPYEDDPDDIQESTTDMGMIDPDKIQRDYIVDRNARHTKIRRHKRKHKKDLQQH